jgi:hypothetical protein
LVEGDKRAFVQVMAVDPEQGLTVGPAKYFVTAPDFFEQGVGQGGTHQRK